VYRHALIGLLLVLLGASSARGEQVYRYVDQDGVMVFTNTPPAGQAQPKQTGKPGKLRRVAEYDPHIEEACALYRIPVPLALAVISAESNFDPKAVSPKGAMGLMQLMPPTAAEMFVTEAFDPKQNIHGGVRYLRVLANMFDGDMVKMGAAYNAGPTAVNRAGGVPNIAETKEYVRRVVRLYFAYKAEQ